jgi:hypothetical protein
MALERGEAAAVRARTTARRLELIRERLERLQAGEAPTPADVLRARDLAAAERSEQARARERLLLARLSAADRHREAASHFERAGQPERADDQRRAAVEADGAARLMFEDSIGGSHALPLPTNNQQSSERLSPEQARLRRAFVAILAARTGGGEADWSRERRQQVWEALVDQCAAESWRSWADAVCRVATAMLPSARGAAVTGYDTHGTPEPLAASDAWTQKVEEIHQLLGEGPAVSAHNSREPIVVTDLAADHARWPGYVTAAAGTGLRSLWALPLLLDGVSLGSLTFYRTDSGRPKPQEWLDAAIVAEVASTALLGDVEALESGAYDGLANPVHVATGVLAVRLGIETEEALSRIRAHAFSSGHSMANVANAILDGEVELP